MVQPMVINFEYGEETKHGTDDKSHISVNSRKHRGRTRIFKHFKMFMNKNENQNND